MYRKDAGTLERFGGGQFGGVSTTGDLFRADKSLDMHIRYSQPGRRAFASKSRATCRASIPLSIQFLRPGGGRSA